jgi:hypothetical protein
MWYSVSHDITEISREETDRLFSVIGIASARVPTLRNVEAIHDPTFLNAGVLYWTCAETAVAHLCAAAPAIRPLYVKLRDNVRRKRQKTSHSSESDVFSGGSVSNRCIRSIPGLSCQQVTPSIPELPDDSHDHGVALHHNSLSLEKSSSRELEAT